MPADPAPDRAADLLDAYRRLVADVHELAHVTQRISDAEARKIGATASQWHVLSVISDGARTVPSIARRLGLSRQAVQRTCDELFAAGAAVAVENPRHQRSPLVQTTESGLELQRTLYTRSESARLAVLDQADLTLDDLDGAARAVRRLLDAMAPHGERTPHADG